MIQYRYRAKTGESMKNKERVAILMAAGLLGMYC
jgi:hypothetical protein